MTDLRTDYDQLADTYDEDRRRYQSVPADEHIAALASDARVLDIGCGTATYLSAQADYFADNVRLFGADPSAGMLAHAVAKVPSARFAQAAAEALPFSDASFAYVACGFTFHHVVDKDAALADIVRVLSPGGRFRMTNVEPYSLGGWWVFTFFDGTHDNDLVRFWPPDRIASALESLGCEVDIDVTVRDIELPVAEVRVDAERRVISQLAVLDDERYAAGLARLRALGDDAMVPSQDSTLSLTASKR